MNVWLDATVVLLALTSLGLLGSSRLNLCIRLVAVQGIVFGFAALFLHPESITIHLALVAVLSATLKGIVFPRLLLRTVRDVNIRHEMEPFVGYSLSLAIGVALLGPSVWLGARLPLSLTETGRLVASMGLFTTMSYVGMALLPFIAGIVADVAGFFVAFCVTALAAVTVAVVVRE